MSKAKLYEALPWLTTGQALDWLKELTGTKIKASEMMQLCEADRCCFYLDCSGVEGSLVLDSASNDFKHEDVKGSGYCKFIRFASISYVRANGNYLYRNYEDCMPLAEVEGPAIVVSTSEHLNECGKWWLDLDRMMPMFKPSDIKDLAVEMNALATSDTTEHCDCYLPAEAESLRQQLEQERAVREAEALKQAKLHVIELEGMRQRINIAEEETKHLRQLLDDSEAEKRVEFEGAMSIISELRDKAGSAELLQAELDVLHEKHKTEKAAREAAEKRAELAEAEAKPSHLLAIAGLLELLLDDSRPRYKQGSAAEAIEALHPDWKGASASKLTKLFAEAKAAAKEADKVAQDKAEVREAAASRATARNTAKS